MIRIICFNINGLRARPHQLQALKEKYDPDVIALQEIKVSDEDFPEQIPTELGFNYYNYGQKGFHGVAIFSKKAPIKRIKVLEGAEAFLYVWQKIPKYRFLYKFFKLPIIFTIFKYGYEIVAYFLYLKNKKQLKN